jgi:hypothetical protein
VTQIFAVVCMFTDGPQSTANIDLGVTNKF